MKPILFSLGPISIFSYGFVLACSLIISLFIMWRLYKNNLTFLRYKVTLDAFFDSVLVFLVSFAIGARFLHISEHFDTFGGNILRWVLFLHFPGFSFLGGIIGGTVGLFLFCKSQKLPFLLLLDLLAVGLSLALAFSRIGSLLAGDAYGKPTDFFLRVVLSGLPGARHPTQLYEAIGAFGMFVVLYIIYNRGRMRKGELFLYFLLMVGTTRFFIEMLRADSVYLAGFPVAQLFAGIFILFAVFILVYIKQDALLKGLHDRVVQGRKMIERK